MLGVDLKMKHAGICGMSERNSFDMVSLNLHFRMSGGFSSSFNSRAAS